MAEGKKIVRKITSFWLALIIKVLSIPSQPHPSNSFHFIESPSSRSRTVGQRFGNKFWNMGPRHIFSWYSSCNLDSWWSAILISSSGFCCYFIRQTSAEIQFQGISSCNIAALYIVNEYEMIELILTNQGIRHTSLEIPTCALLLPALFLFHFSFVFPQIFREEEPDSTSQETSYAETIEKIHLWTSDILKLPRDLRWNQGLPRILEQVQEVVINLRWYGAKPLL